ncbi:translation elongation factor Ts [Candidatus Steffania adelgidicola]|uniref:translation elongation factor Ts n=1 Tax=Candidatus Steffania adelgidicola TaxID=1076626 RepID=UPI001D02BF02|nr:translation elongation factor Ts [Candidatus Steffania adelgidicola]UDG79892.1 Elongation factor Ts [Candidatus Steffania adelgidicola]
MVDVTATLIKELRERTGSGIMECKMALLEAEGDIKRAIDNMRKSGQAKAAKKARRIAAEGIILIKIAQDSKYGVILELNCETDFVAKDRDFKTFGDAIITSALNERITDIQVLKSKFEDQRIQLVTKIGENINIRHFGVVEGDVLGSYLHGTRIGVIVSAINADQELLKHIAMHIAASKPEYINTTDVPPDVVSHEYQIQLNIAMQSGKPRTIAEKIVEGRIRKFINEISLIGQHFVMDPSKTVGQLLSEHDSQVKNFVYFAVGQGIEKAKVNFVDEVAAIGKQF